MYKTKQKNKTKTNYVKVTTPPRLGDHFDFDTKNINTNNNDTNSNESNHGKITRESEEKNMERNQVVRDPTLDPNLKHLNLNNIGIFGCNPFPDCPQNLCVLMRFRGLIFVAWKGHERRTSETPQI